MYIYVDESGSFIVPQTLNSKVACIAGLVIPECQQEEIFIKFKQIRDRWGISKNEVKGSSLDESRIDEVISLLSKYEVFLDIIGMDTGVHSNHQIDEYKKVQAKNIIKNLTLEHSPSLIAECNELKERMEKLPNQ